MSNSIFKKNLNDIGVGFFLTHELFEERAASQPDAIAVISGVSQLSYGELNRRANQVGSYLRKEGVRSDSLVGICLERSFELIIGLLGTLKAGGAYVPFDPEYPEERLAYMLEDAGVGILLTTRSLKERFKDYQGKIICLDEEEYLGGSSENLPVDIHPENLAYVIYTSGSTGKPKGVAVTHGGLMNYLSWARSFYEEGKSESSLLHGSTAFDMSVTSLYLPLINQKPIEILEDDFSEEALKEKAKKESRGFIKLTPSHLTLLQNYSELDLENLTTSIIVGGENLTEAHLKGWKENNHKVRIYNEYGPTEATVACSVYEVDRNTAYEKSIPIGKPITNTEMHILDEHLNVVPIGVSGEIYIGGVGLARGYLGRRSLTAEKFVPNPFKSGERLYRTGDLGRYLEDGNIEFLGRIDHQVKIRGYRIELGEVESVLQGVPDVKQAVVLAREDIPGQKKLVAYIVSENEGVSSLCREACEEQLPEYMCPSQVVVLEALPLTPNGKIDRKALPAPEGREGLDSYEAPQGEIENTLASIWEELLGIEKVGRHDNFFSLGGDSIISIQAISKARRRGLIFEVRQLFQHSTIAGLSPYVKILTDPSFNTEKASGAAPLIPIQQWFFENFLNINYFNQAMWIVSESKPDLSLLKEVIRKIYGYHDELRIKYRRTEKGWEQYYSSELNYTFEVRETYSDEAIDELQRSLDIEKGPLSRLIWFKDRGLYWVIHHLIIDGVSWRILLEDLNLAYEGEVLPLKSTSYKSWGEYLEKYDNLSETKAYYNKVPLINLPARETEKIGSYTIELSKSLTQDFLQKAQRAYKTQANDLLITALVQSLGEWMGQYDVCIEMEGHGREPLDSKLDLTRTVGWFTTQFPVYLHLTESFNLDRSIKEIKEQLREVPHKGVTYGIASYLKKEIPIRKCDISFNYLGQWDTGGKNINKFQFGNYGVGPCTSEENGQSHTLEINGQVKDGHLSFTWFGYYKKETIKKLADDYRAKLSELIIHCSEKKTQSFTPSDFSQVNEIDQGDLDKILSRFG